MVNLYLLPKKLRLGSDAVSLWNSTLALVLTTVGNSLPNYLTHRSTDIVYVLSRMLWFSILCSPQGDSGWRAYEISAIKLVHRTMTLPIGTGIYLWRPIVAKLENTDTTKFIIYSMNSEFQTQREWSIIFTLKLRVSDGRQIMYVVSRIIVIP
jgi:hypothetical protein